MTDQDLYFEETRRSPIKIWIKFNGNHFLSSYKDCTIFEVLHDAIRSAVNVSIYCRLMLDSYRYSNESKSDDVTHLESIQKSLEYIFNRYECSFEARRDCDDSLICEFNYLPTKVLQAINRGKFMNNLKSSCEFIASMEKMYNINTEYINLKDSDGNTALHHAIRMNNLELMNKLISLRCDLNIKNNDDYSPLSYAIRNFCNFSEPDEESLYDYAAIPPNEIIDIIKLLIHARCDLNIQGNEGSTPLHEAVYIGNIEICKLLIDSGCDLNIQADGGTTPLHDAIYRENLGICKLLIDSGCDLSIMDETGNTALHDAVIYGFFDICALIISNGADVYIENENGESPIYMANKFFKEAQEMLSNKERIYDLFDHCKREEPMDKHGIITTIFNHYNVLAESDDSINNQDSDGNTPLHKAIVGFKLYDKEICINQEMIDLLTKPK